jgi:hypothetical protein
VNTRLPDGSFSNQKSKFGEILEGLAMKDIGVFYGHLVHFAVFCYILWIFGIVHGNLVYFSRFGSLYQGKSDNLVVKYVHLSTPRPNLSKSVPLVAVHTRRRRSSNKYLDDGVFVVQLFEPP